MARSFGLSPWGRWFSDVLLASDDSGRLSRGKSYANTGKVASIQFSGQTATAKVAGHSMPWYKVSLEFPALKPEESRELSALIEADPMLLSRIEAGELPAELIDRLKTKGIALVPPGWSSVKRSCSCPDWGDPCKHMAAVYYILAQEIDRDPALLFRLRGFDLAEIFSARYSRSSQSEGEASELPVLPPPFSLEIVKEALSPIPDDQPRLPRLESYMGFIGSLIPQKPPFAEMDFAVSLVEFYHRAAVAEVWVGREARPPSGEKLAESGFSLESRFAASRFRVLAEGLKPKASPETVFGQSLWIEVEESGGITRRLGLARIFALFLDFEDSRGSEGYRFLFFLSRLAEAAFRASAFVPVPYLSEKRLRVLWTPLRAAKDLNEALEELGRYDPGLFPLPGRAARLSGRSTAWLLLSALLGEWVRSMDFHPSAERAPLRPLVELFFAGRGLPASKPGERSLPRAMASWLSIFSLDFEASKYRFRLEIEEDGEDEASLLEDFSLGMRVLLPETSLSLMEAVAKLGDYELLRIPTALASYIPELHRLATEARVRLGRDRLSSFLGEASSILKMLGVEVVVPKSLKKNLAPKLVLDVRRTAATSLVSYLDLPSVLEYDWRIAVGDQLLSAAAFEKLVKGKKDIVFFRDGYLLLDAAEVSRLLDRARREARLSALDLVAARLSGEAVFSTDAEALAASLFEERDEALPAGLAAVLRPYQERGYRWILANLRAGFGCLLADDMGLGKTVQAIAAVLHLKETGLLGLGALVVAPAALITNWERELSRFAPGLTVLRYHGPRRKLDPEADVTITTYETAARDVERLQGRSFSILVCDEAQLLKNAQARRTQGVKLISAERRLALSGTPVENRLEDLRSIFDIVLPGYLGGPEEFKHRWREKIEIDQDQETAEKLRRVTSPFLMRRLKTDKSLVPELPDKIISDEFATLAPGQAALYESVVRDGLEAANEARDPKLRSSLVLKLLTALKQICDHPRVYDKESPAEASLSGKSLLLVELLGQMLSLREKVLVFSQYVETLTLLETIIAAELDESCLVYHGGLGKKSRDESVDAFQKDPGRRIMLVSLKAGGLGLNLTAASRVVHYDLWFNPAVENQASDRAFRIGQERKVFVHRLIAAGTFEEKIDAMLKAKAALASMSVASGESWIGRMGEAELRELFQR